MSNSMDPPKRSKGDLAYAAAKTALAAIPYVGGPAAELFQLVIKLPLERRRDEWMRSVGEKLQELEQLGVDVAGLSESEEFVTAALHASSLALRTHHQEKLEALRNAVLNVAIQQAPEDALQHMFFQWIESMSPLHLRLLKYFQAPPTNSNISMGALANTLEQNIPELRGKRHIYDQVWKDLYANGLTNTENLHVMMTGNGLSEKRTSQLGDAFIAFISAPSRGAR